MCLTHHFSSYFIPGLANGFLYALIALGYTLVYGVLQLINFAHSEVFMSGGFGGLFALNFVIGNRSPSGLASVGFVIVGSARRRHLRRRRGVRARAHRPTARYAGGTRRSWPSSSARSACRTSCRISPARNSGVTRAR